MKAAARARLLEAGAYRMLVTWAVSPTVRQYAGRAAHSQDRQAVEALAGRFD